jgi:methylthioribose-1-phosphate isomerase
MRTIEWDDGVVKMIDQRKQPSERRRPSAWPCVHKGAKRKPKPNC